MVTGDGGAGYIVPHCGELAMSVGHEDAPVKCEDGMRRCSAPKGHTFDRVGGGMFSLITKTECDMIAHVSRVHVELDGAVIVKNQ